MRHCLQCLAVFRLSTKTVERDYKFAWITEWIRLDYRMAFSKIRFDYLKRFEMSSNFRNAKRKFVEISIELLEISFELSNVNKERILRHFTIITQETPDMNKENYMKSTTARKDLWWSVGGR